MKNYVVGTLGSLIIFIIGLVYLTIPVYYGFDNLESINVNNLFISAILIYSIIHFVYYISCITEPNIEEILFNFAGCITGVFSYIITNFINGTLTLSLSLILFTVLIVMIKIYTINYFKKKKDYYYYIEMMLLSIFVVISGVISFNLYQNNVLEILMLGFIFIIISVLDLINVFLKNMMMSKKFSIKKILR